MSERPKVWLVPDLKGWSYDQTARALVRHLSHRFEFRIAYKADVDRGALEEWPADLYVDFWWRGRLHERYGNRVVKQISSHRWAQAIKGSLRPTHLLRQFADNAAAVVVPSLRLFRLLTELETDRPHDIHIAPKGFDPSLLEDYGMRRGEQLSVGWAGVSEAKDKHVDLLVTAEPDIRLADHCLTQREMGDFYNGIDVIAIASSAEGDPRPLIEGMACGCFPISTDVGIVPELVIDGVNGLIVERTPFAFVDAFNWCRANLDYVRAAGRRNAIEMRRTRRWEDVTPIWGDLFDLAISRSSSTRDDLSTTACPASICRPSRSA